MNLGNNLYDEFAEYLRGYFSESLNDSLEYSSMPYLTDLLEDSLCDSLWNSLWNSLKRL